MLKRLFSCSTKLFVIGGAGLVILVVIGLNKKTDTLEEMQARSQLAQDISNLLFTRNQQGGELERAGSIDEAVALYEANIADEFPGDYPYERLRIIYSKRGDYQSAHRICAAYLQAKPNGKLRAKYDGYILQYRQKLA